MQNEIHNCDQEGTSDQVNLVIIEKDELSALIDTALNKAIHSDDLRATLERAVESVLKGLRKGDNTDHVLSIREAAAYLKTSDRTLRRMVHEEMIPAFRIRNRIFIRQADLDQWIEKLMKEVNST